MILIQYLTFWTSLVNYLVVKLMGQNPKLFIWAIFGILQIKYWKNDSLTWPLDTVTYLGITIHVGKENEHF